MVQLVEAWMSQKLLGTTLAVRSDAGQHQDTQVRLVNLGL